MQFEIKKFLFPDMQIVAFEDGDDGTGEVSKRRAGSLNGREKGVAENELFSLTSVIGAGKLEGH